MLVGSTGIDSRWQSYASISLRFYIAKLLHHAVGYHHSFVQNGFVERSLQIWACSSWHSDVQGGQQEQIAARRPFPEHSYALQAISASNNAGQT